MDTATEGATYHHNLETNMGHTPTDIEAGRSIYPEHQKTPSSNAYMITLEGIFSVWSTPRMVTHKDRTAE